MRYENPVPRAAGSLLKIHAMRVWLVTFQARAGAAAHRGPTASVVVLNMAIMRGSGGAVALALLVTLTAAAGAASPVDEFTAELQHLKRTIHTLSPAAAAARIRALGERTRRAPPPPRQGKVDHVVVLYMENHPAAHFFGCMGLEGFDGTVGQSVPRDPADPSLGRVNVTCGNASYVCSGAPGGHGPWIHPLSRRLVYFIPSRSYPCILYVLSGA
jgi:hypothetical protein